LTKDLRIELLSPDLLQKHPVILREISQLAIALGKELGWSYWVDLIWILTRLKELQLPQGSTILDAGGGLGLLQFVLAVRGFKVISIDFSNRDPHFLHRWAFDIDFNKQEKLSPATTYQDHVGTSNSSRRKLKVLLNKVTKSRFSLSGYITLLVNQRMKRSARGAIFMIQADIHDMHSIEQFSVDAVVSCSVIEHMDPRRIPEAIEECRRVLKPNRPIILTTSAAKEKDWFHEPSKGWCFTKETIGSFFKKTEAPGKWEGGDQFLLEYQRSEELKRRLASSYFMSGDNGMPWGIWDPQYIPAGVVSF
jgi:cyclopropane fatty-acyl-phospholipid synthase-like methyltransferase